MEPLRRNYYGIIPIYILENRALPAHCKIAYAWITSVIDSNNIASFPLNALAAVFDVDEETTKRWLYLLTKENHIIIEYKTENEKEICIIELMFPQRPAMQDNGNHQADVSVPDIKTESKQLPASVSEIKKEIKQIELTPEQIIRKHFDIEELQQEFKNLDLTFFELPNWSAKLQLKYKNSFIRDPHALLDHLRKWLRNSKHINMKTDVSDI